MKDITLRGDRTIFGFILLLCLKVLFAQTSLLNYESAFFSDQRLKTIKEKGKVQRYQMFTNCSGDIFVLSPSINVDSYIFIFCSVYSSILLSSFHVPCPATSHSHPHHLATPQPQHQPHHNLNIIANYLPHHLPTPSTVTKTGTRHLPLPGIVQSSVVDYII